MKSATINIRVPEDVKENAKSAYEQLGIDISTAINVFLRKSIEYGGFPFEVRSSRPNKETIKTIVDAENGIGISKKFDDFDEFWEELNA